MNVKKFGASLICVLIFQSLLSQVCNIQFIHRESQNHKWDSLLHNSQKDSFGWSAGYIANSLFESPNTHQARPLDALILSSKGYRYHDSDLIPLLWVDDTLTKTSNLIVLTCRQDTNAYNFLERSWQQDGTLGWVNLQKAAGGEQERATPIFNLKDYLIPLPCDREEVYIRYFSNYDIYLSWSGFEANGLTLEQTKRFIEEELYHQKAYHQKNCYNPLPVTLEFMHRNADIREVTRFLESLVPLGVKLKVLFPLKDEQH